MLVIIVVHRCHSCVGLLAISSLWMHTWCVLVLRKPVLGEVAFRSVPAQVPLGSVSVVHVVLSNRDLMGQPRPVAIAYDVWESLGLTNNSKEDFSHAWCWFLLYVLFLLGEVISLNGKTT